MLFFICCCLFIIGCMQGIRTKRKKWRRLQILAVLLFLILLCASRIAAGVIKEDAATMQNEYKILTVEVEHEDILATETDGLTIEDRTVEFNERLKNKQTSAFWNYLLLLIPNYYNDISQVSY